MSTIDDDDLDAILRELYPQGYSLLRCEGGIVLLHHGARHILGTPTLVREVLGAKGTRKMADAVRARSERYASIAERLYELAPPGADEPAKADCTTHVEPADGNWPARGAAGHDG
jgi:hypothetical protein